MVDSLLDPWQLLLMAGGAVQLVLGVGLMAWGRRSGPALVLGLAFALWGAQALLVRTAFFVGPREAGVLRLTSLAFLLPLPLLFLHFAAVYPSRLSVVMRRWWMPVLTMVPLAALAIILVDPSAGVRSQAAGTTSIFGWVTSVVLLTPHLGAMVLAQARFASGYRSSRAMAEQRQHFFGGLGLAVFLAGWSTQLLYTSLLHWGDSVASYGTGGATAFAVAAVAGFISTMGITAGLAYRAEAHDRAVLLGLPLAAVLSEGVVNVVSGTSVLGLWRIVTAGLLFYAVAKYQFLDVDLRLRRLAPTSLAVGGGAVAGLFLSILLVPQPPPPLGAPGTSALALALCGAGGLLVRSHVGAALEAAFPYVRASQEYLARRRLEVYRAAVVACVPEDRRDALAEELQMRPWEREVLDRAPVASPAGGAPGALLHDRYRLDRFLAPGMYGRVFLAHDGRVGEPVVLKEYAGFGGPTASGAFAREAKTLGGLDHPNVLAVRDVFRAGEDMYIALEHAPEGSLEQRLTTAPLPEAEALDLAKQLLGGLAAAHRKGVVHRDVKPANLLFKGHALKLADFGVAFDPVFDGALRASEAQPGTLLWMAPEQALGKGADKASDVHAAGAVLYRLLAGKHYLALEGRGEQAVRRAIATRTPALPLAGVSERTNAVLGKALAKDPGQRYADAAAMLKDLRGPALPRLRGRPVSTERPRAYGSA